MMEHLLPHLPSGALFIMLIGSVIAIREKLKEKPSYDVTEKRYMKKEVCEEVHKSIDEKLNCIPEMRTSLTEVKVKLDILIKNSVKNE